MVRLHAVVEGQTEETFVNRVLVSHLAGFAVYADVRSVETSRRRHTIHRGGVVDYGRLKRDLQRWMHEDDHEDCYYTTMIDLYRLPSDFPRYAEAQRETDPYRRVELLERAFEADLGHPRFVPYLQLHEFEALLFVNPSKLIEEFVEHAAAVRRLVQLAKSFGSPELIDDGPETAPSKRIIREISDYEGRKVSAGPRVVQSIGLTVIRVGCPHFDSWLRRIEALEKLAPD